MPITQDASASAYQLISNYLLDYNIAVNTNLIPSTNSKMKDIYIYFQEYIKVYLQQNRSKTELDHSLYTIVINRLTQKLVKYLLIPMVYGKSVYNMREDLYQHFSTVINKRDCYKIAKAINSFFEDRLPHILNLMKLVHIVGWLTSALEEPVRYSTPVLTTVQDYMKSKAVNILVYDRKNKKRSKVTLGVPTQDCDRTKTTASIFANFINQKDGYIAYCMIRNKLKLGGPIYTVHDNFISTPECAMNMAKYYIDIFTIDDKYTPLGYINQFIIYNLIGEPYDYYWDSPISYFMLKDIMICLGTRYYTTYGKAKSKKDRLAFSKKFTELSLAYLQYIRDISQRNSYNDDINMDTDNYIERWDEFSNSLLGWDRYPYNYSLHF